jgi:hypothetical protein
VHVLLADLAGGTLARARYPYRAEVGEVRPKYGDTEADTDGSER